MKLKVCGMKFPDNIKEVAALQPDYLGFIFYEKSVRFFNTEIPTLHKSIKKVGVFVDADLEDVIKTIKKHDLQAVQLHGSESPEYCETLKRLHEECQSECSRGQNNETIPVKAKMLKQHFDKLSVTVQHKKQFELIKVFSIKDEFNFEVLKPYESVCDYYLFDTKGKLPGGNGYTFNWSVLNNYPSTKPYFLSGGIGLNEAESVLSFLSKQESKYCYAIDVNSKFEIEPGLKDIELLKKFKIKLGLFE